MTEIRNALTTHLSEAPVGSDAEHTWIIESQAQIMRALIKILEPKASTSATAASVDITAEEIAKIEAILPAEAFTAIVTKGVTTTMKPETVLKKKQTVLSALLAKPDTEFTAHIKRVKKALGITDTMIAQVKNIRQSE